MSWPGIYDCGGIGTFKCSLKLFTIQNICNRNSFEWDVDWFGTRAQESEGEPLGNRIQLIKRNPNFPAHPIDQWSNIIMACVVVVGMKPCGRLGNIINSKHPKPLKSCNSGGTTLHTQVPKQCNDF